MNGRVYVVDEVFEAKNYVESPLEKGEYDGCTFSNCSFAEADITQLMFNSCEFIECDFSSGRITGTSFQDVQFRDCKMLGVRFDTINQMLFGARFVNATLDLSSFYQVDLRDCSFINCKFNECDFAEADLSGIDFPDCDFQAAVFDRTNLEGADLSGAINYSMDPNNNRLKGAKVSRFGAMGFLTSFGLLIKE